MKNVVLNANNTISHMNHFRLSSFLLPLLVLVTITCSDNSGNSEDLLNDEKQIEMFTILEVNGIIDTDNHSVLAQLPLTTDVTSLAPEITISDGASISPESGAVIDFTIPQTYTVTAENNSSVSYMVSVELVECASGNEIITFEHNDSEYEIIKSNKTWIEAAACAVERNGYLATIDNESENNALFQKILNSNVPIDNTSASDGGEASYLWIGGNDIETEGVWIWDGDNDGNGLQFWQGGVNGVAVNNAYINWGTEPDNFNGVQHALGLAITQWPVNSGALGSAGQWNDVDPSNKLYFIIEKN